MNKKGARHTGWFTLAVLLAAYVLVPQFQDTVDNLFEGISGTAISPMAERCYHDYVEIEFVNLRPNTKIEYNGNHLGTLQQMEEFDGIAVPPGSKITLIDETTGQVYVEHFVSCESRDIVNGAINQLIGTINESDGIDNVYGEWIESGEVSDDYDLDLGDLSV